MDLLKIHIIAYWIIPNKIIFGKYIPNKELPKTKIIQITLPSISQEDKSVKYYIFDKTTILDYCIIRLLRYNNSLSEYSLKFQMYT